jgi:hypothetical protein
VPFSISIPQAAAPGGHFAAIFWGNQPPGDQGAGQIAVGGKLGILVLLRVSGDITEGGGIADFGAEGERKFFSSLPVAFVYRVNNTGGDRIVPTGSIVIENTLRLTSATLPANPQGASVLPGSTRKFKVVWADDGEQSKNFFAAAWDQLLEFRFGWYAAQLDLEWSEGAQSASAGYSFFIVPWQLLLIILVLVLCFGFLIPMGIRRYNRWLIAKVTGKNNENE